MGKVQVSYCNHYEAFAETIDPVLVISAGMPAEPTFRLLEGSDDEGYAEEWQELASMPDGRRCMRIYLFCQDEIADVDGELLEPEFYPWNNDHVRRIKLLD
jgi:hypothetical protein